MVSDLRLARGSEILSRAPENMRSTVSDRDLKQVDSHQRQRG